MDITSPAIYLERIDVALNMARFYSLAVEIDLFGEAVTIRRWGRIGSFGRQIVAPCSSMSEGFVEITKLAAFKRRRGYRERTDQFQPPQTARRKLPTVKHAMV